MDGTYVIGEVQEDEGAVGEPRLTEVRVRVGAVVLVVQLHRPVLI